MEKRFIIAIFLITLVMIVSNEYLWKKPISQQPTPQLTKDKEVPLSNQKQISATSRRRT